MFTGKDSRGLCTCVVYSRWRKSVNVCHSYPYTRFRGSGKPPQLGPGSLSIGHTGAASASSRTKVSGLSRAVDFEFSCTILILLKTADEYRYRCRHSVLPSLIVVTD